MILENQNVFESPVFLQVENAVAEGPQHVFDALRRHGRKRRCVIWRLDDDLVGADAVHLVEEPFGLAVQITFDPQRRELVGDHSHSPSGHVALRRRAAIRIRPICLDFRRRLGLIPRTERTESAPDSDSLTHEICGTFGAIGRDDYPAADNWIFPKLRQVLNPFNGEMNLLFYVTGKAFLNNSKAAPPAALSK